MKGLNMQGFERQDIKMQSITPHQLDAMQSLAGSYESLFSRRAKKYKSMELSGCNLGETDYRQLILDEYTFLKRPVFVVDKEIFTGSSPQVIASLQKALK